MNIRSLTRGDGVVIGAAVLLFIASFLKLYSVSGYDVDVTAWDNLGNGLGTYMSGVIAAALIVVNRILPQPRKVAGLDLGTVGAAFTVLIAWELFWSLGQLIVLNRLFDTLVELGAAPYRGPEASLPPQFTYKSATFCCSMYGSVSATQVPQQQP